MSKGTTKTPWEHFMNAASSMERTNRANKKKAPKVLTLKQQLDNLEKTTKQVVIPKKARKEQKVQFSYAPDVLSENRL